MWGGYNLAAFNLLLELTPDDNRSMYIGAYNTFMVYQKLAQSSAGLPQSS